MKRKEKALKIARILETLYPNPPIPLHHSDPFTLLVSVVLSAQTTDKKVNQITPALFARASTAEKMAQLPFLEILELIKQIGLAPTKAKALIGLSQKLMQNFAGQVPNTFMGLESLSGVGHKTASVVMAQAFGHSAFPVDTHIHRLATRWGLSKGKNVRQVEQDLKKIFDCSKWNKLHLQMIYFGREYCPSRRHELSSCQICGWAATKKRMKEEAEKNAPKKRS